MTRINIKGPIVRSDEKRVYEFLKREHTCAEDVVNALPTDGSDVRVIINSGGGDLNGGREMYTAFKAYDGTVVADIVYAGSAAGLAAMGATTVRISPVGQFMLHNVQGGVKGDHNSVKKAGDLLEKANEAISLAYQLKTGKSQEEILGLMEKTTWLTAEEAVKNGFADEILFAKDSVRLTANSEDMLAEDVVTKIHALLNAADRSEEVVDMDNFADMVADKVAAKLGEQLQNSADPKPKAVNPLKRFVF